MTDTTNTKDQAEDRAAEYAGTFRLSGRGARRALRRGHRLTKPLRSRCQRYNAKQRAFGPGGKAFERKERRRLKRAEAWLAAEQEWQGQAA